MDLNHQQMGWILLIACAAFNSVSALSAKYRLNQLGAIPVHSLNEMMLYLIRFLKSPLIWFAIGLFSVSPLLLLFSLNKLHLSVVYPSFYASNMLFIFILSMLILNEQLSVRKFAGAILLVAAFYLFYSA